MRIAIIGAGIGGLAAAHDLVQAGHEVVVFEAASQVGGLASGFKEPHWDWSVEQFYHHWFASDRHVRCHVHTCRHFRGVRPGLRRQRPRPYRARASQGAHDPDDLPCWVAWLVWELCYWWSTWYRRQWRLL